jgi:hypothetical protein
MHRFWVTGWNISRSQFAEYDSTVGEKGRKRLRQDAHPIEELATSCQRGSLPILIFTHEREIPPVGFPVRLDIDDSRQTCEQSSQVATV